MGDLTEGYVYVLSNECMPGIYKIGCTTKTVQERSNELSRSTSIPLPFIEEMSFFVFDVDEAEKKMHEELKQYRVNKDREFFRVDTNTIKKASKCLFSDYNRHIRKIAKNVQFTGEYYYEDKYLSMLEPNFESLKEESFNFECFTDIFKKEDSYYYAICYAKICTEAQYQEWLKEKCIDYSDTREEEEIDNKENGSEEQ